MKPVAKAYVLVKTDPGSDEAIRTKVGGIEGIVSTEHAYGAYDMVVKAELNSGQEVDNFIYAFFDKVRATPGVKDTLTLITVQ